MSIGAVEYQPRVFVGGQLLVDIITTGRAEQMRARNDAEVLARRSMIGVEDLQESGATVVDEVGYALASGVDFIAEMRERGLAAENPSLESIDLDSSINSKPIFFRPIRNRFFGNSGAAGLILTRRHPEPRVIPVNPLPNCR